MHAKWYIANEYIQIASHFHHLRKDDPCSSDTTRRGSDSFQERILCGDKERTKSRYAAWGNKERAYLEKHLGTTLIDNDILCKNTYLRLRDIALKMTIFHPGNVQQDHLLASPHQHVVIHSVKALVMKSPVYNT